MEANAKLTRDAVTAFRKDAKLALERVAKEHHMQIGRMRATYTEANLSLRVEVASFGMGGEARTKDWEAYRCAAVVDPALDPEALGNIRAWGGTSYRILGYKRRASRYPIVAERTGDGKGFNLPKAAAAPLKGV
jgi:hypothetical protein